MGDCVFCARRRVVLFGGAEQRHSRLHVRNARFGLWGRVLSRHGARVSVCLSAYSVTLVLLLNIVHSQVRVLLLVGVGVGCQGGRCHRGAGQAQAPPDVARARVLQAVHYDESDDAVLRHDVAGVVYVGVCAGVVIVAMV